MIVLVISAFIIGYLVGAKQEQKRLTNPKEYIPEPEVVEQLQTLAGIKEHDKSKGSVEITSIITELEKKNDAAALQLKSKLPDEIKKAMMEAPIVNTKRKYNKTK